MDTRYDGEWVITALLEDRARRLTDRTGVRSLDGDLSYGELADRAARIASGLRELGVQPGDRVATMLESTIDYLAAWHGTIWAGAIDVPVNTELRGGFLAHILRDSGARVLIVQDRWIGRLAELELPELEHVIAVPDAASAARAATVGEATGQPPAASPAVGTRSAPGGETSAAGTRPLHRWSDLLGLDPGARVARTPEDLIYILYTSGTTGPSKGVCYTNRSASWLVQACRETLELRPGDVGYSMFPLFHTMGRSALVTASLWMGSPVVLRPRFSVSGFWRDIREQGVTWFGYFGAVILFLWREPEQADDAENPARLAFGASAPAELIEPWERRFGLRLHETYGSTELGTVACPKANAIKRPTMGRPVSHIEVEIHDERDEPVPPGALGEIVARPRRAGAIFAGYWNRPAETVEAWRNLWFHSGDAGTLDEDGCLTFRDRKKDSIRRRGENISSFEVERAVRSLELVVECAAYPVPSEHGDDEVMVAIVIEPDGTLDASAFCAELIPLMPRFAIPRYVRVLAELPKTPSQRVRKHELRAEGVTADTFDREALGVMPARD
ncbi:MAG TPA: AMP-binding protein [Solirubrobacteraceae bacterium]|jgi:crotonobetaine/carnitine-CoA ligase|nr:AMP-binding protein [Solirubrobacteraceae bacterium]